MSFIDNIKDELNVSITENGAVGYETTGKNLLDFNFRVASYRNMSESLILKDFTKAWLEDKELALKYLFYVRDIREGLGERRLFRVCITSIIDSLDERVFDWIGEYGRYDDLFVFFKTKMESAMIAYVAKTLEDDCVKCMEGKPVTLLAKWMPSVNTSSKETRLFAKIFARNMELTDKEYRKTLSRLRAHIDVLERKLCANEWNKVEYSKVPSQANLKYNAAFFKHDQERREEYLANLQKGDTKINAATLFPHDVVNKYNSVQGWNFRYKDGVDVALEELWKALPNYVDGSTNTLVVRDGSGSMSVRVGKTNISALDVSTALAIYFSERCEGQFKNQFITFSSRPQIIDMSKCETLRDKLELCYQYDDCSNTNIEATFDLILRAAINNDLKQEDIPNLLIISDMEFDGATTISRDSWSNAKPSDMNKLFVKIEAKFNNHGYKLPRLIFWNVNSRTMTIPLTENQAGVILVSGFSPAVTKLVLAEETNPYKALVKELNSERYAKITLNK